MSNKSFYEVAPDNNGGTIVIKRSASTNEKYRKSLLRNIGTAENIVNDKLDTLKGIDDNLDEQNLIAGWFGDIDNATIEELTGRLTNILNVLGEWKNNLDELVTIDDKHYGYGYAKGSTKGTLEVVLGRSWIGDQKRNVSGAWMTLIHEAAHYPGGKYQGGTHFYREEEISKSLTVARGARFGKNIVLPNGSSFDAKTYARQDPYLIEYWLQGLNPYRRQ